MKLSKVLAEKKDKEIYSIQIDSTLKEAAELMSKKKIGALLIIAKNDDPESYVGLLTERTIINNCWKEGAPLDVKIREAMNEDLVIAKLTDDVITGMSAMARHKSRYVGICEDRKLVGLVSMTDIINSMHEDNKTKLQYLSNLCGTYGNKVY